MGSNSKGTTDRGRRGEKLKKLDRTRKRDTEREETKRAWNKYVGANIPELKVT